MQRCEHCHNNVVLAMMREGGRRKNLKAKPSPSRAACFVPANVGTSTPRRGVVRRVEPHGATCTALVFARQRAQRDKQTSSRELCGRAAHVLHRGDTVGFIKHRKMVRTDPATTVDAGATSRSRAHARRLTPSSPRSPFTSSVPRASPVCVAPSAVDFPSDVPFAFLSAWTRSGRTNTSGASHRCRQWLHTLPTKNSLTRPLPCGAMTTHDARSIFAWLQTISPTLQLLVSPRVTSTTCLTFIRSSSGTKRFAMKASARRRSSACLARSLASICC